MLIGPRPRSVHVPPLARPVALPAFPVLCICGTHIRCAIHFQTHVHEYISRNQVDGDGTFPFENADRGRCQR